MGMGAFLPLLDTIFNLIETRRANRIQQERADTAIGMIGDAYTAYATPELADIYDPYDYAGLNEQVEEYIRGGAIDGRALASEVGGYFSDASTDAFERAGLADVAAGSDARTRSRIQQTVGSGMARGRGLDELSDALQAMDYQENVARGGQALGVQAAAEQMRNETNIARGSAMGQARLTGEELRNQLTQLRANLTGQIGMAQGDQELRAALAALAASQSNADRALAVDTTKAGIYTGVPYALFQSSAGQQIFQNIQASKPPKTGGGFGIGVYDVSLSTQQSCVDGEAVVTTPLGAKPLRAIGPTDQVMGADWRYHKVIAKDYGEIGPQDRQKYVKITASNTSITCTADHVIGGKRADEWQVEDVITVDGTERAISRVDPAEYVMSGDLALEGGVPYLANGFVVESIIGKDLDAYRDLIDAKNQKAGKSGLVTDGLLRDANNPDHGWVKAA